MINWFGIGDGYGICWSVVLIWDGFDGCEIIGGGVV